MGEEEYRTWKESTTKIQKKLDRLKKDLPSLSGEEERIATEKIKTLEKDLPDPIPVISTVRNDLDQPTPIHVLKRANRRWLANWFQRSRLASCKQSSPMHGRPVQ